MAVRAPLITKIEPRFPRRAVINSQAEVWQNLQLTLLKQQDRVFEIYDWPNPRGPVPAIDLKTWTKNLTYLIGQDQFFGLAGHPNFNWPNPRGPQRSIDLLTWFQSPLMRTVAPFAQTDWPNPTGKTYPSILRSWQFNAQQSTLSPTPFASLDWPNPFTRFNATSTGFTVNSSISLTSSATPFSQLSWPNPVSPLSTLNLGWISGVTPPSGVGVEVLRQRIRIPREYGGIHHWTR